MYVDASKVFRHYDHSLEISRIYPHHYLVKIACNQLTYRIIKVDSKLVALFNRISIVVRGNCSIFHTVMIRYSHSKSLSKEAFQENEMGEKYSSLSMKVLHKSNENKYMYQN